MTTSLKLIYHWNNIVSVALYIKHDPPRIKNPFKTFDRTIDDTDKCENNQAILCASVAQLMRFNDFLLIQSIYFVHICSPLPFNINWTYFIKICIITLCVGVDGGACMWRQHQQHTNYAVCLPGGRRELGHVVCWRPQLQAAIPQQHLRGTSVAQGQHRRVRTHTETLHTVQTTGPISTRTSTLWLQFHKTSVATKTGWRRSTPRFIFIQKRCDSY